MPPLAQPAALACAECRRRHLKCDGQTPRCARCTLNGRACAYTPSRRGIGGGPRACRPTPQQQSVTRIRDGDDVESRQRDWSSSERDYLLDLYYEKCYPAHPLLVPRRFYESSDYPQYIDVVVRAMAMLFNGPVAAAVVLREFAAEAMAERDEQTAHRVKFLVLSAVLLYARHQLQDAEAMIRRAADLAIAIGLNKPDYAAQTGCIEAVEQESLRRTWWELYIVEACIAALRRKSTFTSGRVDVTPYLPCEESFYMNGRSPTMLTLLHQFEGRAFAQETLNFAPYCYRIEAVRILARVIALAAANDAHPDDVQAVDNAIASWKYYLPTSQGDFVDAGGHIDQMLFQANMFIHCANVFLHFPRSDLPLTVPTVADITCAQGCFKIMPTCPRHTAKAVAASKELSDLAAVPWPVERHSPFFVCGLTLGCIVQLAISSVHLHTCTLDCLQQHRDRVTLMLGALKHLGPWWNVAQHAHQHLRTVAGNVFTLPTALENQVIEQSTQDRAMAVDPVPVPVVHELLPNVSWFDLFSGNELRGHLPLLEEDFH